MIVNSSQYIQTSSNPLESISSKRVNATSRSSSSNPEGDNTEAVKAQQRQDDTIIRQLRARDREVRAHEAAHVSAGGSLVRGGPNYTLQTGPDGRSYAIGGEVQLDVSPVANDPQATITKAAQIRAAALAPAQPSAQDVNVASNANELAAKARVDLAIQRREEANLAGNQETLERAADVPDVGSESDNPGNNTIADSQPVSPPDTGSAQLQSNDLPVAAISAFMATAQIQNTPVLFSQFA